MKTWIDVQSLAFVLMRVPPAAIAKWCLTNTTSKQRGAFVVFIILFLFSNCKHDLQNGYKSGRNLRISERLLIGIWWHYARVSSE